jgi:Fic/DOC family
MRGSRRRLHRPSSRRCIGPGTRRLADGWPEKMGLPSADVAAAVDRLVESVARTAGRLDPLIAVGSAPTDPVHLGAIVQFAALAHGEWVRIHPFANGNGRTARVWAAWVALRYGLPAFVTVKPRPAATAYANVSRSSMGRPPDFAGDHEQTRSLFTRLLNEALAP